MKLSLSPKLIEKTNMGPEKHISQAQASNKSRRGSPPLSLASGRYLQSQIQRTPLISLKSPKEKKERARETTSS
jgi:hypothetical protein